MVHLTAEACEGDVAACLQQWLMKSTTAFHQHANLNLPWTFGIFCWNYAVAGVVLLQCRPAWIDGRTRFPYAAFSWLLILVQAPLSFYADFMYMDQDSIFHVLDRLLAIPCFVLEMWKILLFWRHGRTLPTALCNTGLLVLAAGTFLMSQDAQSRNHREDFILWHNLWHLYPILASILTIYDHSLLGCYEGTKPKRGGKSTGTRTARSYSELLSSLLRMVEINKSTCSRRSDAHRLPPKTPTQNTIKRKLV